MKETDELYQRMDGQDETIDGLVKSNTAMQKRLSKISEIKVPDYSEAIETLTRELRESRQNDHNGQLVPLLNAINEKLDKVPQSAVRQLRILLFPEVNPEGYYKIVFGRFVPWAFGFLVATFLFLLGRQWTSAWGDYRFNKQSEQCVKAWLYLDEHSGKQVKKAMAKAWLKSEEK